MDVARGREDDAETLVFINYRSGDNPSAAGFLHAALSTRFGPESIFLDYESIPLGREFPAVLEERVRRSAVLLVVVGERWLDDELGGRLVHDPQDWVRKEILIAFEHGVPVVPVLFGEARIVPERLPEELSELPRLQAFKVGNQSQGQDMAALADRLVRDFPRLGECTGRQVRTVAECRDPVALGVHAAMEHPGGLVPPYVPRHVDASVRTALREGRHVLLVGDSTAGKSRTAYEAMRVELPGHVLVAPADAAELATELAGLTGTRTPHVLWLDDLHRYLGAGVLTARSVAELTGTVVVIATIGRRTTRSTPPTWSAKRCGTRIAGAAWCPRRRCWNCSRRCRWTAGGRSGNCATPRNWTTRGCSRPRRTATGTASPSTSPPGRSWCRSGATGGRREWHHGDQLWWPRRSTCSGRG
ncbi:hypothetical protein BBK82_32540 [Lentzea guizhouensis]|uniref:TIR domain-containing protein n=1 Tax=Lentzea guizhouensis TaxID=1586287 RepID=A0A1B2HQS7_9PSEU|nr:toll/interleukin-1 receptor domain-containing protein [Lentzea guizhouensis]ANZ40067.1 hypothetical protein BBK82_32540 [Lentzea guizhouensis]